MPLVDKNELAEKWGPDENLKLILFATNSEKKKQNPKLPDFQGYISDNSGNVLRAVGWRKTSKKGTVMLTGELETTDVKTQESKENKSEDSDEIQDIPF